MKKNNLRVNSNQGFTLIELLITFIILSIIVTIVFSSFRTVVRVWQRGERDIEANQQMRIGLGIVKKQISSIDMQNTTEGWETPFILRGDSHSIVFVTFYPANPNNIYGKALVKYIVQSDDNGKERLALYEKDVLTVDNTTVSRIEESEPTMILPPSDRISFEYLSNDSKSIDEWQDQWNIKKESKFPLAVQIKVQEMDQGNSIKVIARLGT